MSSLTKTERSLQTYLKRSVTNRPKNTVRGINKAFNNFEEFCRQEKNCTMEDAIKSLKATKDEEFVFDILQDWISWNTKRLKPSSIPIYFSNIKQYLHYRGIKLNQTDIKQNLVFPEKVEEEYYPLKLEEIRKLLEASAFRFRGIYIAQLSSGMRIGELVQIKKRDLILGKERVMIKITAHYTKKKRARTVFISKEASKFLPPNFNRLDDDALIWGTNSDPDKALHSVINHLRRILPKIGLDMKYPNSSRSKITTHSFRAYCITKISRHDENLAKMLAGQKGYLLQYDRLTDEEKLAKYIEFEGDLLVYDTSRKDQRIKELESKDKEITELRLRMGNIEKHLERVIKGD